MSLSVSQSNTTGISSEIIQVNTSNVITSGYNVNNGTIENDAVVTLQTWSQWSACSKTCGGCGVQTRRRTCVTGTTNCWYVVHG